jgi:hypothetical protein
MPGKISLGYAESACYCLKTIKHVNLASKAQEQKPDMTEIICLHCWDLMPEPINLPKGKFYAITMRRQGSAIEQPERQSDART